MAAIGLNPVAAYGKDRQSVAVLHIEELGGVVRVVGDDEAIMAIYKKMITLDKWRFPHKKRAF